MHIRIHMSEKITFPAELATIIEKNISQSELHGIITGMLCLSRDKKTIIAELSEHLPEETNHDLLTSFIEDTHRQLADANLGFELILPEDDNLAKRGEGISHWTEGFIAGLIAGGVKFEGENIDELTEIFQDLAMISDIDYSTIGNSNEDEAALFELEDYLRIAAATIYTDFLLANKTIVSPAQTSYIQ